jgi:geranylgeranylglycerol-phosphate geranylgeranyltransferase
MKKILPIIRLSRPVNLIITFISIFIGAFLTESIEPIENVLLACLSGVFIAAAANTINDYFDLEIDRVNKPYRPLPSGLISPKICLVISLTEYGIGLILGLVISIEMFFFALLFSILLFFYSAYLKRTVVWGNFAVSASTAAAFIYGGLSVGNPLDAIIPAIFAFFYHFSREILKDIQDMEGDRKEKAITFPIRYGIQPAIQLIRLLFAILLILVLVPYITGWYGFTYLLIVLFGVYPVIIYVLIKVQQDTHPGELGFLSNLLKADMLIGLLAIYFK